MKSGKCSRQKKLFTKQWKLLNSNRQHTSQPAPTFPFMNWRFSYAIGQAFFPQAWMVASVCRATTPFSPYNCIRCRSISWNRANPTGNVWVWSGLMSGLNSLRYNRSFVCLSESLLIFGGCVRLISCLYKHLLGTFVESPTTTLNHLRGHLRWGLATSACGKILSVRILIRPGSNLFFDENY